MKPTDGPRRGQLGLEINWGPLFPFVKLWVPPSAGTSRGHTQARLVRSGPSATLHQTASKDRALDSAGGEDWGEVQSSWGSTEMQQWWWWGHHKTIANVPSALIKQSVSI